MAAREIRRPAGSGPANPPPWLDRLIAEAPYRQRVKPAHTPAVAVYVAATGKTPPPMSGFEDLIAARVGAEPPAVRRWAETVATWAATHEPGHVGRPYNLANVRGMLDSYAASVERDPLAVAAAVPGAAGRPAEDNHRALLREIGLSEAEIDAQLA